MSVVCKVPSTLSHTSSQVQSGHCCQPPPPIVRGLHIYAASKTCSPNLITSGSQVPLHLPHPCSRSRIPDTPRSLPKRAGGIAGRFVAVPAPMHDERSPTTHSLRSRALPPSRTLTTTISPTPTTHLLKRMQDHSLHPIQPPRASSRILIPRPRTAFSLGTQCGLSALALAANIDIA